MKQYNIYSGLGGSFGITRYQYTDLYETQEEAEDDAFQAACENYDRYAGLYGLFSWKDAIEAYCADRGIDIEEFNEDDDEALQEVEEYYNDARENCLCYHAIPTDEDNIDQKDLILGYVIEDDSTSQTNSK